MSNASRNSASMLHVLALAAAVLTPADVLAAQPACEAPITLDLSVPRPALPVTVAGKPVRAVLDTGAVTTIVGYADADALHLKREGDLPAEFQRLPGTAGGYATTLPGVVVGGLALGDIHALAMAPLLPGYAVVLSPNAFGERLLILDLATATLRACDRAEGVPQGETSPYDPGPLSIPTLRVQIGAQVLAAHLDTGSPMALALPMRFAQTLALEGPLVPAGMAHSHTGPAPIFKARLAEDVRVGPLHLPRPEVLFTDAVPEPNVGTTLLRRLTITLDPKGRRTWAAEAVHGPA